VVLVGRLREWAGGRVGGRGEVGKNREQKKQARWIGRAAVLGYGIAYSIPEVLNRATILKYIVYITASKKIGEST